MKKSKAVIILLIILLATLGIGYIDIWGTDAYGTASASDISLGLDLAGGVSITYQVVGDENPSDTDMADTIYKLQQRVTNYSTEAQVYQEGSNRINIEIPGVSDANAILQELGKPGTLYFIAQTDDAGNQNYSVGSSGYYELNKSIDEMLADGSIVLLGTDVADAKAVSTSDQMKNVEYAVSLTMTDEGREKFAKATEKAYNKGETIAIYYDEQLISVPRVQAVLTDGVAQITGSFTYEDAEKLASTIRIGGLKLELEELHSKIVGAQLGSEAISTSLKAGLIGFIVIVVFMIAVYRISGLAASLALALYVELMIILLDAFEITLTLPGIAGIILSIGMAVDANVLIFEHFKEEYLTGKTLRAAMNSGFKRAFTTIFDSNITTIIASIVLFMFGTGSIRGFAITLGLGVVLSMITAISLTQFMLKLLIGANIFTNPFVYGAKAAPATEGGVKRA